MKREKWRKAVFAVGYFFSDGKIEYLLLKRKKHWTGWEFTKGKIEKNETKKEAAIRESEEESGLKVLGIKKFNVHGKYFYKKILEDRPEVIGQTYDFFAARLKKGKVKLDKKEHSKYKWMSFDEAMKKLTWPNQRKSLKIVNKWIKNEI